MSSSSNASLNTPPYPLISRRFSSFHTLLPCYWLLPRPKKSLSAGENWIGERHSRLFFAPSSIPTRAGKQSREGITSRPGIFELFSFSLRLSDFILFFRLLERVEGGKEAWFIFTGWKEADYNFISGFRGEEKSFPGAADKIWKSPPTLKVFPFPGSYWVLERRPIWSIRGKGILRYPTSKNVPRFLGPFHHAHIWLENVN